MSVMGLPRLVIVDDLFGRQMPDGTVNEDRANLCARFLLKDITGDESETADSPLIKRPIAEAVFLRGQTPVRAGPGDHVENDLETTLTFIRAGWENADERWAMALLDLCFYTGRVPAERARTAAGMPIGRPADSTPSGYFGLKLLEALHRELPDLPILILSSKPRGEVSRTFSELGALGFLPRSEEEGPELLADYIWRHGLIPDDSGEIIGTSKSLLMSLRTARRAAVDRRNVLIRGERGTGKELLARYLHRCRSADRGRPFTVVDSGTLSPSLYASELFGHRRGAFTGAERDYEGKIAQAQGGDLFLDEIGNMPPDVQAGLLRVLEQRTVTPLGSNATRDINVRFLAATNEDLEGRAATGGFRQDLLDRLRDGGTVFLRPLRERVEDIQPLAEAFIRQAEAAREGTMHRVIEPEALNVLESHPWPGNIRELRSCLFNAVFSFPDVEHLVRIHLHLAASTETSSAITHLAGGSPPTTWNLDEVASALESFDFGHIRPENLVGRLPAVEYGTAQFIAGLLRAALRYTMRTTPDNPEGQIMIHPAVKLLTGDKRISASRAADIIKRLLNSDPQVKRCAMSDAVLRAAYEKATRLRPSRSGRQGVDLVHQEHQ